jgi:hypothetical protein
LEKGEKVAVKATQPKAPAGHEWVLKPLTDERSEEIRRDEVFRAVTAGVGLGTSDFAFRCKRLDEYHDYFPGENALQEEGDWVMVKTPPSTEYTVTPFSFWFAVPWPMKGIAGHTLHRVKIKTPRGDLGLFSHEYSKIQDIGKYFEFIGDGIDMRFFGGVEGVPRDALFYLRSRGISKSDAIKMLLSLIRSQEVCWLETRREAAEVFFRGDWPSKDRLV